MVTEDIHAGDFYTLEIKIVRKNPDNGYIHSKRFPFLKKESLFMFIFEENTGTLVQFKRIVSDEREILETF